MEMYLRINKLRYAVTMHDVDASPARDLSKQQLALLADLAWIGRSKTSSSPAQPAAESRTWPARWAITPAPTATARSTLTSTDSASKSPWPTSSNGWTGSKNRLWSSSMTSAFRPSVNR
jgi:hypothetical protein